MPILNVCDLCKIYQAGEAEVKALDNVSFAVEKGEFVSIIGPSGSGKSTLLHILAGIDRPTSGKVYVDGEDIYAKSEKELAYYRRRKAGLIYQFYNLVPTLTVEENITLPCRLDKKKTDKETIAGYAWNERAKKSSAEPAFRRSATTLCHRQSFIYKSCAYACRRTDRKS